MSALLGRKIGMTRYFTEQGHNVPVTVIEVGPCVVTQVKTADRDGYDAVQIGFGDIKPRNSTMPIIGHDAKAGSAPRRWHREFRTGNGDDASYELGQVLDCSAFDGVKYVDVRGVSKGKGFQGVMKRHNFAGMEASHGVERKHRSAGSICGHATNRGTGPKPKKGKRMAGRMGGEQVTTRNLDVVSIDAERGLLLVKGPVPGPNQGMLFIEPSKRLSRQKARLVKAGT